MKDLAEKLDRVLKKRFFIAPTAQIYGGVSGLYDYGPFGLTVKNNLIHNWRKFFVEEEDMLEIDASILTPHDVLKASGHVDKFSDMLIFDLEIGECFRADHFIEEQLSNLIFKKQNPHLSIQHDDITNTLTVSTRLSQASITSKKTGLVNIDSEVQEIQNEINSIESMNCEQINAICKKYDFKSPAGNPVGNCTHFNLMFQTFIGPKTQNVAFLRPETAQSQFVNFKKLLELNNDKLPFASASIGKVFRNEISPRNGLLRVREFEQAEIEYFVFPDQKNFKKFINVSNLTVRLLFSPQKTNYQQEDKMTLLDAISHKIIDNETLAYFIGRTQLFLTSIGIKPEKLRFRQHKTDEMAHYACDCWDAEIETSAGWIECVGIADRSCYDLNMHEKISGADLKVRRKLQTPVEREMWVCHYDKKDMGKKLRTKMKTFEQTVDQITQQEILQQLKSQKIDCENSKVGDNHKIQIKFENDTYQISVLKEKRIVYVEELTPNVIEPSFGIGRIFYSLLEHCFWTREDDEQRNVLSLKPKMAPYTCVYSALRNSADYDVILNTLKASLAKFCLKFKHCNRNVSIGKKYSTYDELGVPFFVTVDQDSLNDHTVTIRERDSTNQIRVAVQNASNILYELVNEEIDWDFAYKRYKVVQDKS